MDGGEFTTILILSLTLFGAISIPYWSIKIYGRILKSRTGYKITVEQYNPEFEELLRNIIHTHTKYYNSSIKVNKI